MAATFRWGAGTVPSMIGIALGVTVVSGVAAQSSRLLRLGPATASFEVSDELFTGVSSIRELSGGRVLVTDYRENRIALVDFARNASVPVGRHGDGPGEYRGAGWLHPIGADSSILIDYMTRRWVILDGAVPVGTFPPTHPLIVSFQSLLNGSDRSGHLLGTATLQESGDMLPARENADSLAVILAAWPSPELDTVARIKGRGKGGLCIYAARGSQARRPNASATTTCNWIPSQDHPLLFPDGWIAIAMTDPYRVDWRAPDGRWVRGEPLSFEPVRIDEELKCAMVSRPATGIGMSRSCGSNRFGWPDFLPPFFARVGATIDGPFSPIMLATSDGNLLIRRAADPRTAINRYDLIDRKGDLIGRLELPRGNTIVGFGSSDVYTVDATADGLQRLRRHVWPPMQG